MQNKTNKCIHRYVNSLYYKQRSLLHVLATYCGHLQWCSLKDILFIYKYITYKLNITYL
jgi:hypothetical protein